MKVVADASVVAKWFNVEEYTEESLILKEDFVRGVINIAAPLHLVYEVGNSIWRNKQLNLRDAVNAVASLIELNLELTALTAKSASRTMEVARETGLTFYDALYIQLAEEKGVTLITADRKQLEKAEKLVTAIHVREYPETRQF